MVFLLKNAALSAPFDAHALELRGDPIEVAQSIQGGPSIGAGFAVSPAGAMLYVHGGSKSGVLKIMWVDQEASRTPIVDTFGSYFSPRISPDGKRVAFSAATNNGFEIRVKDLERDTVSRLSFVEGSNQWPVWTPDGNHILFRSSDQPKPGLYWTRADGTGGAHRLTSGDETPYSFSRNGRLALWKASPNKSSDMYTALLGNDPAKPKLGVPELFADTAATEIMPSLSADGRWIAYASDETGMMEISVRSFRDPAGRWQVSSGGGMYPVWSPHAELLYRGPDQRVMAVPYKTDGNTFIPGKARLWSQVVLPDLGLYSPYDLAPDGKRMAVVLPIVEEQAAAPRLVLLINFIDELQRRTAK